MSEPSTESSRDGISLKSRVAEELWRYFYISAYLFVCFSVLIIYEDSQTSTAAATSLGLGLALVKALILGKFILIGDALKPGTRVGARTLLHRVAWRTAGMIVVLIVFKFLEELIVGMVHGEETAAIFGKLQTLSWLNFAGPILMMTLILVPLMVAVELDRALGEGGLKSLLAQPEPR